MEEINTQGSAEETTLHPGTVVVEIPVLREAEVRALIGAGKWVAETHRRTGTRARAALYRKRVIYPETTSERIKEKNNLRRPETTFMANFDPKLDARRAKVLSKASDIFGSQNKAEEWLNTPAIGLDGQCPITLLHSEEGAALVQDFLTRLDYGVYS